MSRQGWTNRSANRRALDWAHVSRHGWTCHYCGHPVVGPGNAAEVCTITPDGLYQLPPTHRSATIDHVIPLVAGGTNDLTNLVLACDRCNSTKGDALADSTRADAHERMPTP